MLYFTVLHCYAMLYFAILKYAMLGHAIFQ